MLEIICGDRHWSDELAVRRHLEAQKGRHQAKLLVITGGAAGADDFAKRWCKLLGISQIVCPANWEGQGLAAGPARNRLMLRLLLELTTVEQERQVTAFHNFLPNSKGTRNMVEMAEMAGVRTLVIGSTLKEPA